MDIGLHQILMNVQKPARYTGGEYNQIVKDRDSVRQRIALCFPDTYEIGMSNLGMRILYGVFNECSDIWCERVFAPWRDMQQQMREHGIPLFGLESGDAIRTFDIIAFSIGYEMAYTTVLDMIDLAGLPVRSCDRSDDMPLICAGGTVCYNSEPMADFIDLFFIGEGEEVDPEVFRRLDPPSLGEIQGADRHVGKNLRESRRTVFFPEQSEPDRGVGGCVQKVDFLHFPVQHGLYAFFRHAVLTADPANQRGEFFDQRKYLFRAVNSDHGNPPGNGAGLPPRLRAESLYQQFSPLSSGQRDRKGII